MKRSFSITLVSLAMVLAGSLTISSCETEEDPGVSCTGCPSNSAYAAQTGGTCYPTKVDCENSEGTTCYNCS